MTTYRAGYFLSSDRQCEVVLTLPEHATLSDEARSAGVDLTLGTVEVGTWTE